jgi:four helix bundle protein
MEFGKIQSFTDLDSWKEGHQLVLEIYTVTKSFPKEEAFGLTSQLRRCTVSITSNIAEGFSQQSYKEKTRFYIIAKGSLTELQNQLLVARDVGFITPQKFTVLAEHSIKVHKILNGLIRTSKSLIPHS